MNRQLARSFAKLLSLPLVLTILAATPWRGPVAMAGAPAAPGMEGFPLRFEPGRTSAQPTFRALGGRAAIALGAGSIDGTALSAAGPSAGWRLELDGADPGAGFEGTDLAAGPTNVLIGGDPSAWRANVTVYREIRASQVWPGVDAFYSGVLGRLDLRLVVAPGADLAPVALRLTSATTAQDAAGNISLGDAAGGAYLLAPTAQDLVDGERHALAARYAWTDGRFGIAVDGHDPVRVVEINVHLVLPGVAGRTLSPEPDGLHVALGTDGAAYVAGRVPSHDPSLAGGADAFVAKLDPTGRDFAWVTYLGGSGDDSPEAIAVDPSGRVAITGRTTSPDLAGAAGAPVDTAGGDAFVTVLDATGAGIVLSKTIGGSGRDTAHALAFDPAGTIWIAGETASVDLPATAQALQPAPAGGVDGFLAALAADGTVSYLSYLGGSGDDSARAIAVRPGGGVVVTGSTRSQGFPVANALQAALGGGEDIFVTALDASGALAWSTYLGGAGDEAAEAVAVARDGRVIVAGRSAGGLSGRIPGIAGIGPRGGTDAFVAALAGDGSAIRFATELGGSGDDVATSVAVDRQGHIHLAGRAGPGFPSSADAKRVEVRGTADAFEASLGQDGGSLLHSALVGGIGDDAATGLTVDGNGKLWLAGTSASADPVDAPPVVPLGGGSTGFLAVIDDLPPAAQPLGTCPGTTHWVGGATGAWETPANWSGGVVPTSTDDVCVDGAFAVTLGSGSQNAGTLLVQNGASLTIANGTLTIAGTSQINGPLNFNFGTLTGAGNVTISGLFTWGSGTLAGTGSTTANGGISFTTAGGHTLTRSLTNPGGQTATYAGTGGLTINTPGTFTNSGTFTHQTDAPILGSGTFTNSGTFQRTSSAGNLPVSCPFNNTGAVDVQSGEMTLSGSGTHTGTFDSTGAILTFGGGTHTISGAVTGTEVDFTAGTVTFNGSYNVTGTTNMTNGTATFSATSTVTNIGSDLNMTFGTMTFNSGETIAPTTLELVNGTMTGSDAMTISGLFTFGGGTMGGTGATTANGGIALTTGAGKTLTRQLTNAAGKTATFTGTGFLTITIPGTFSNSGIFTHQTDAAIAGTGLFANSGTFNRTTSVNNITVSCPFNNTGSVVVSSGELTFSNNGTHTGSFDSTGAILTFAGGTHTLSGAVTGTEVDFTAGTVTFNGSYNVTGTTSMTNGTATFSATSTVTNIGSDLTLTFGTMTFNSGETIAPTTLELMGGTMTGSDPITISGLFTYGGGTMGGTGATTANGGIALTAGVGKTLTRQLTNAAGKTATFTGAGFLTITIPGTFLNPGTFTHQTDAVITGTGLFANSGTFNRTTSLNNITVSCPFNNSGSVNVSSGELTFSGNGTHTGSFDSTGAILTFGGGTHTLSAASSVAGTEVDFTAGTVTFNGTYGVTGTTSMANGTATWSATSTVTNIGSDLSLAFGTMTFNSGETIAPTTLELTNGTMTGSDNITVSGLFTWATGTMGGTGNTTANGGVSFTTGNRTLTRLLTIPSGKNATCAGTGGITITAPGIVANAGTWEHQSDAFVTGTGTFNNAGAFNRTTSVNNATISCPFNNTGSVDVQTGELTLSGNGTHTGTFDSTGAILTFQGGTHTSSGAVTGTEVDFTGGTETFNGTYNVTGTTSMSNGTVTFSGTSTMTNIGSDLTMTFGTMTFNSGETIAPTTLELTNGTITGSDNITISGLFTWASGTLSGTGNATANGGMALDSGNRSLSRLLTNTAGKTATVTGFGGTTITAPGQFANAGTYDLQSDAFLSGSGSFKNSGAFNRTTSPNNVTISCAFDNTGSVDVQAGELTLAANGTHTGSFDSTGTILTFQSGTHTLGGPVTGTEVDFTGGTETINGSYNVTGTTSISNGTVTFSGTSTVTSIGSTLTISFGNVTFNSGETIAPGTLNLSGGTLSGSDAITIASPFNWAGGQMSGTGTTTANGGVALNTGGVTLSRIFNNASGSTAVMSGNGSLSINTPGVWNNLAGSTFDGQADSAFFGSGTFANAGTFVRTTGAGIFTITCPMTNSGTVESKSGTLTFTNSYTQTAGATRLNGGAIDLSFSAPFAIQGGVFGGTGTVGGTGGTITNTGGTIAPGFSPGLINATTENVTQGAGGSYNVEIAGLTPGTQYDQIDFGTVILNGTLNVSILGGFAPSVGDSFTIVTGTSVTGTFATTNLPALPGGNLWKVTYTGTTVVLSVIPPTSADLLVTKSDAPDPVNAGGNVTYTITVKNNGPDPATGVTLTDPIPASTNFVSATPSQGSCSQAAGTVTCPLGGLANGATATVTIVVTTTAASVPSISNTATATANEFDPSTPNTATATTTVNPVADLSMTKGDAPDPINAGGTLTYTLSVTNAGPNTASSLTVTDTLPAGVAFVSATGTAWICNQSAGIVTCTRASLAVGAAPDITIVVTAPGAPGSITNNASVTSTTFDPTTPNTASATTTVTAVADLTITKTDAPDPVNAGANVTYTITVANVGPSTANALTVTDTLPAGVTFVSATGTGWVCNQAAGVVTCTRASLAVTTAPVVTIVVTAPAAGGSIVNTATVTATEFDPTTPNTASATTTVTPIADLSIVKTDAPDPVNPSSTLTYTLAVSNAGPSTASTLTVTDTLPAGVAFLTATGTGWACSQAAGVVTCTRASLAPGAAPAITITVTTPSTTGLITNNATVAATTTDTNPANNSASASTTVSVTTSDLSITKTDAPDPLNVGGNVTYTITVKNNGPDPATGVTLTDPLPASTTFVSAVPSQGTCSQAAGTVTCPLGGLANGATATVTIIVTTTAASAPSISNTASVTANEFDPSSPNTATATTTVNPVADLSMTKGDAPDPINAGGTLTYTLSVTNAGPSTAANVTVTDTLPAAVAFVSATGTGWVCNQSAGIVTCTRASLAVGAAPDITIVVTAPGTPGSIVNNATVTSTTFDPTTPNTATASTSVTAVADLTITKTDAPDPVNAGANVTYTITVANVGPSTANSLTVTDTLPAGVTFVSATGTGWVCNQAAGVVTCTRASLTVTTAPVITIVVTAPAAGGSIVNTATVTATEFDPTTPNTASASTTVTPVADLSILKSVAPDPVDPAAAITYTLAVTNAGPSTASTITVTDNLPPGTIFVSATGTGWACSQAAGVVTCTRASLAVGAAPAITIVATAPSAGGSITNVAAVTAATADPTTPNTSSASNTVRATADLAIAKTDSPDPVDAGAALTYTVTVINNGPDTAQSLTVTDTLPAGATFVSAAGTGWVCTQAAGVVTCTRASLAAGPAPAITIVVNAPAAGGAITNTATVAATSIDLVPANNSATAGTTVTPVADLSIVKTDSPDPVNTGSTLTYTLTVNNGGPSPAAGLTVTDPLPAGVTFVSATGTGWVCTQAAGTVTCTRAALAVGGAPPITITVTAPGTTGALSNTATVAATTADPSAGNNSSTQGTTVSSVTADLSITKTDAPDPLNVSGNVTYTIAVKNNGPDPATGVKVTDPLPASTNFVSATSTQGTCSQAAGTVTCLVGGLANGATATVTIVVTTTAASAPSMSNTAAVTANEADSNLANNTATASTTVTPIADLAIAKTDSPDPVNAGATLTYTVTVTNIGPSPAASVIMTDTLPVGVTFVSATGTGWACGIAAGTVTCTRAAAAVGAAPVITITVTAPANAGSITNTATVTATTTDPVATNNSASAGTTVAAVNDLSIVKTASAPTVAATATFSYTLAVSNAGPSASGTVTVTDPLPAGATFQSASGTGWTCTQASGTVTCTRTSLAVGAAPAITITVKAPNSAATLTNTATVAATGDPAAGNDTSTASVTVTAAANLRATKTASPTTITDDSNVTYTISVKNVGPSTATNVVVTDALPAGATFLSATGNGWTCSATGNTLTCTRPTLGITTAPAITIVVSIFLDGTGVVVNSATVASSETDPVPADNTGTASVNVVTSGGCSSIVGLIGTVRDAGLGPQAETSLLGPLEAALAAEQAGSPGLVANKLALFIQHVRARQAAGRIDGSTATQLIACATQLSPASGSSGAAHGAQQRKGGAAGGR